MSWLLASTRPTSAAPLFQSSLKSLLQADHQILAVRSIKQGQQGQTGKDAQEQLQAEATARGNSRPCSSRSRGARPKPGSRSSPPTDTSPQDLHGGSAAASREASPAASGLILQGRSLSPEAAAAGGSCATSVSSPLPAATAAQSNCGGPYPRLQEAGGRFADAWTQEEDMEAVIADLLRCLACTCSWPVM